MTGTEGSSDGGDGEPTPRAWAILAVVLALGGIAVNVWRPLAPALGDVDTDLATFAPQVLETVAAYRGPRVVVAVLNLALLSLLPVALVVVPAARRRMLAVARMPLRRGRTSLHDPLRGGLVGAAVVVVVNLVVLPLAFWVGHVHESSWGFRTAGPLSWLRDWAVGVGVEVVIGFLAGGLFVLLVRVWPRDWHWRLVVLATVLTGVLALLFPLVVQPLTLSTEPLAEGPLRTELEQVVAASGLDADLVVGDASRRTTKVNAFVVGLGPSQQVVLWDTLLQRPQDEVVAVVAHELAHWEHQDILRGVLLSVAGVIPFALVLRRLLQRRSVVALLGLGEGADPAKVLVLVALAAVGQLLALPVTNAASRRVEAAADHRALELTSDPEPLVRTFRGFVLRDLGTPAPSPAVELLFGTHPANGDRIRAVVQQARRRDLPVPSPQELREAERAVRHPRIP